MTTSQFKKMIWRHYRASGRHDLAWRKTRDPYHILVSEIMLQQTPVSRVKKFYPIFIKQFPNFRSLARARTVAMLRAWQGLGYNRRALALQKLSRTVLGKFNGRLPRERAVLESLPGVGAATAGAIRAFAWNEPEIFVETNIRRVFIHFFLKKRRMVTDEEVKRYIKRTLPIKNSREWYLALMDYGAMLGARSAGGRGMRDFQNPNKRSAQYRKQPVFLGSNRELRGKILALFLDRERERRQKRKEIVLNMLAGEIGEPEGRTKRAVNTLIKDGFIKKWRTKLSLSY